MCSRKELKDRAKAVMLRSYTKIFLACFITNVVAGWGLGVSVKKAKAINFLEMPAYKVVAVFAIMALIVLIAIAVSVFALAPLRVGLKKFMLENSKGRTDLGLLLYPFQNEYKNIVLAGFMRDLFISLWSILGLIPSIVLGVTYGYFDKFKEVIERVTEGSAVASLEFFGVTFLWLLLTIIFSIPSIIKSLQYSMVSYMLAENPAYAWKDVLSESKEMMVGHKWEYIKLGFSFILWWFVANLCCGIGNLLLTPYIEATYAEYYFELSGQNLAFDRYNEY